MPESVLPLPPCEEKREGSAMKQEPAPDPAMLVPWSRTHSLQDREKQSLLFVRHPARGTWSQPGQAQTPLGKHPPALGLP